MTKIFVTGTVRENPCDRDSAIVELRLDQAYKGWTIHPLADLVEAANSHLLWVNIGYGIQPVRVEIFWSDRYRRFVARTTADTVLVNNLDSLPIVRPATYQGKPGVISYENCPL